MLQLMKGFSHIVPILFCLVFQTPGCIPQEEERFHLKEIHSDWLNVGFLIMDGVYNTELTAPFDIFQHTRYRENIQPMNVFTIAKKSDPILSFEGLRIIPDFNYRTDALPHIDILVVPSAEHHLDTDLEDTEMIQLVADIAENARFVTSHCDGAFVLAKAGLLDTVVSTTFPADISSYREMFPHLEVEDNAIVVHDGKYITSAGGARSFDGALYLTEVLYGSEVARRLAEGLVIDWALDTSQVRVVDPGN